MQPNVFVTLMTIGRVEVGSIAGFSLTRSNGLGFANKLARITSSNGTYVRGMLVAFAASDSKRSR